MEVDYMEFAALRAEVEGLKAQMQSLAQAQVDGGGDGFGPDFGLPITPSGGGDSQGAFAVVDGKITNRHYMVARAVHTVSGNDPDAEDGSWYLVVPHANPGSATLTTSPSGMPGDTQTLIPLFTINNGKITADYRGMPLVMIRE